jgi:uncharacterized beta-barrel protein YwiB (DUF1934 family)
MRQAEIKFNGTVSGLLTEDENGFYFKYYEDYLKGTNKEITTIKK